MTTITNNPTPVEVADRLLRAINKSTNLTLDPRAATEDELADYLGKMKAITTEISKREKAVQTFIKKHYAPVDYKTFVLDGREYKVNLSLYQRTKDKFLVALKKFLSKYKAAPKSTDVLALKVAARRQQ